MDPLSKEAAAYLFEMTYLRNPYLRRHNVSGPQFIFLTHPAKEILYGGAAGGGKALAVDTPIPTPSGWTRMGDLKAGDEIFTESGKVCRVLIAHPIRVETECYRVRFDDGSEINANAEHLWKTFDCMEQDKLLRRSSEFLDGTIRTTREIAKTLTVGGCGANHAILIARETKRLRYIVSCERINPTPMRCITVDDPSGMFLAGRSMIPTHNSYALLMAALQYAQMPGYSALLLRRTFSDLQQPGALIPLSHEILHGTDAKWDGQRFRWVFPSGATIQFGYMDTEVDKYRYAGSVFQFIGYDEATQFTEGQYTFVHSRLRRPTHLQVPLRIRAATNPGGVSHQYFKDRFINPKTRDARCVFIPAKLADNKFLDQNSYLDSLNSLDHVTRAQLRDGNWDISALGGAFKPEWFRHRFEVQGGYYLLGDMRVSMSDCIRFASADIAGTEAQDFKRNDPDYTAIGVWDLTPTSELILSHLWRGRMEIPDVEEKLMALCLDYNVQYAAIEKNGIGLPVVQAARRRGLPVKAIVAKRDKFARSQAAQILMENGQIWFPKNAPWMEDLMSEMLAFPCDGGHDDMVDCVTIASQQVSKTTNPRRTPREHERESAEIASEADAARLQREAEQSQFSVTPTGDYGWYDLV